MGVALLPRDKTARLASVELIPLSLDSSSWPRFEASLTLMFKTRAAHFERRRPNTALALTVTLVAVVSISERAAAQDWITAPSYYTHDPQTGHRVHQYHRVDAVIHTPSRSRSVYRHTRSSLQIGDSIDQYHVVDNYGDVVRPYGEWRFPYRPFSVPYSQWGPDLGWGGFGGYGGPAPGWGFPGYGGGGGGIGSPFGPYGAINGSGFPPPWNDGSYPDVRRTQLPPQPLPVPSTNFQNNINGNDNTINNN